MKDKIFQNALDSIHVAISELRSVRVSANVAIDDLTEALRGVQKHRRRLRKALLLSLVDRVPQSLPPIPDSSDYAREKAEAAIEVATDEWTRPVHEPPGPNWARIDTYIRGSYGLGWESADASRLGEPIPYERDGQFAWCGAFQAWCWGVVGLRYNIRHKHMASLYRIHRWARGSARFIEPEDIERGDVVCMGPADGPSYGQHMGLAIADFLEDYVVTIEGNATGEGPEGQIYEGVTQHKRPVDVGQDRDEDQYRVLYGVRFLEGDFQ